MSMQILLFMFQKTLRDGHFKALQGKLELLERLCRALQKERNDLNNQLSLLQEQGEKRATASPEAQPQAAEQKEDEEEDAGRACGEQLGTEGEDIHQAPRPPELEGPTAADIITTSVSSHPAAAGQD